MSIIRPSLVSVNYYHRQGGAGHKFTLWQLRGSKNMIKDETMAISMHTRVS